MYDNSPDVLGSTTHIVRFSLLFLLELPENLKFHIRLALCFLLRLRWVTLIWTHGVIPGKRSPASGQDFAILLQQTVRIPLGSLEDTLNRRLQRAIIVSQTHLTGLSVERS